jgi:tRNA(Ile)-lysidine synthetase-like protein
MGPRGLAQRLDQAWHKRQLLPRGKTLLVAVSGGADSVALLRLLVDINRSDFWRWKLVVAHISHGIRGRPGTADARFVKALAKKLHLPFAQKSLRLGKHASEAAARDARLAALAALAKSHHAAGVVMAHHADDQAETVLLRILRGTGVEGLAAMSPLTTLRGLRIYRPLLAVRRTDLRATLAALKQPWREDETNSAPRYTRNRIRHELLPALEAIAPAAVPALTRLAHLAADTWQVVETATDTAWKAALLRKSPRRITLRRAALRDALPLVAAEILRRALRLLTDAPDPAPFERLDEALRLVRGPDGGKTVELGAGITLHIGKEVRLEK